MSDIITEPVQVTKQIKTRARQIYIDNQFNADKRIDFISEGLIIVDGKPAGTESKPAVTRSIPKVISNTITINDPITGKDTTISVAGMAMAIEEFYVLWYNEDRVIDEAAAAAAAAAIAKAAEVKPTV